jgi:hypothetical protein
MGGNEKEEEREYLGRVGNRGKKRKNMLIRVAE